VTGLTSLLDIRRHWHHLGAIELVHSIGIDVGVNNEDVARSPAATAHESEEAEFAVRDLRLRTVHTLDHTPGSLRFALVDPPVPTRPHRGRAVSRRSRRDHLPGWRR
jgi:hypothetical protein